MREHPLVRIFIGVTGHIDLAQEHEATYRERVAHVLQAIQQRCPHTPITLLTALAGGADQLCAEVALDLSDKNKLRDLQILAPLPFPEDIYKETMSAVARRKFDDLVDRPQVRTTVLPPRIEEQERDWSHLKDDAGARRSRYAACGMWIAEHSQALIALWDGREPEKPSGTAEVVHYKTSGQRLRHSPQDQRPFDSADSGPVIHIVAEREPQASGAGPLPERPGTVLWRRAVWQSTPMTGGQRFKHRLATTLNPFWKRRGRATSEQHVVLSDPFKTWLEAHPPRAPRESRHRALSFLDLAPRSNGIFGRLLENTDRFNCMLLRTDPPSPTENMSGHLPKDHGIKFPGPIHTRLQRMAVARRCFADHQALYKKCVTWAYRWVFLLIGVAAVSFHIYAHIIEPTNEGAILHDWTFLAAFVGLMALSLAAVAAVHLLRWETLAYDLRAIAEGLRVQFYWGLAGLPNSVPATYLQQFRSEIAWIRNAVRSFGAPYHEFGEALAELPAGHRQRCLLAVLDKWVRDQRDFFQKSAETEDRHRRRCRLFGYVLALLGLLLAIGVLAQWFGLERAQPPHLGLASLGSLFVIGGLLIAFAERKLFQEQHHQYRRMHQIFRHGAWIMKEALDENRVEDAERIVAELGREALTENAGWLILHRARPFEPPIHA